MATSISADKLAARGTKIFPVLVTETARFCGLGAIDDHLLQELTVVVAFFFCDLGRNDVSATSV